MPTKEVELPRETVGIRASPAESSHILPFLSLTTYHGLLLMAGDTKLAEKVKKYMDKTKKNSA